METNLYLEPRAERDINSSVARIIRDLGNPEPPIRLEQVRDLLKLDLRFYSLTNPGFLQETIHRLKVAGKQALMRPGLILDAVKKFDIKALYLQDSKRILLDSDLPLLKLRWNEAHEIIHSVVPWHDDLAHGDQASTLSRSCHLRIESEANYGAGRLLFLGPAFTSRLLDHKVCISTIKKLAKEFGNTITSTFWRTVETMDAPAFGLISKGHPSDDHQAASSRYLILSRRFQAEFGGVSAPSTIHFIRTTCRRGGGVIYNGDGVLKDVAGTEHLFRLESFFNRYETLTLCTYLRPYSRIWVPQSA